MADAKETLLIEVNVGGDAEAKLRDIANQIGGFTNKTGRDLRQVQKEGRSTADSLKRIGIGAGVAFIGLKAVGLASRTARAGFRSMIREAQSMLQTSEQAEIGFARFASVFREEAAAVAQDLAEIGDASGRSTSQLLQFAASIQDLLVPVGFAREEATKLTKDLLQLAIDVSSFVPGVEDEQAINAFTRAVLGEREALVTLGIKISEAEVQQRALSMGLADTTSELTQQDKVLATTALLFDKTKDAQGAAARTLNTYAGFTRQLRADAQDLSVVLGFELQEAVLDAVREMGGAETVADLMAAGMVAVAEGAKQFIDLTSSVAQFFLVFTDGSGGALASVTALIDRIEELKLLIKLGELQLAEIRGAPTKSFPTPIGTIPGLDAIRNRLLFQFNRESEKRDAATRQLEAALEKFTARLEDALTPRLADSEVIGRRPTTFRRGFGTGLNESLGLELRQTESGEFEVLDTFFEQIGEFTASGLFKASQGAFEDFFLALGEGEDALDVFVDSLLQSIRKITARIASEALTKGLFENLFAGFDESALGLLDEASAKATIETEALAGAAGTATGSVLRFAAALEGAGASSIISGGLQGAAVGSGGGSATGGFVGYATGGGQGSRFVDPRDTLLARVSPGEFVLDPIDVRRIGIGNLEHFRQGAPLRTGGDAPMSITVAPQVTVNVSGGAARDEARFVRMVGDAVKEGLRGADAELRRAVRDAAQRN